MECVDEIRNVLIETLGVEKVYLTYLDETEHVHWHLIPRYNQKGYDVLEHDPGKLEDFSLSDKLKHKSKIRDLTTLCNRRFLSWLSCSI